MNWSIRKIFIGLLIGLIVIYVLSVIIRVKEKETNLSKPANLQESAFTKMTPAQHLKVAKVFFPQGDIEEVKTHLAVIKPSDPQYNEAQKLLIKVNRKEKEIQKKADTLIIEVMAGQRKAKAKEIEKVFLEKGFDVYVKVSGKQNEILVFEYVLMSRPIVYKFMNFENFYDNLKKAGYKKVIFSDGYGTKWTYKIE